MTRSRPRAKGGVLLLATLAALTIANPAAAGPSNPCTFDAESGTVTFTPDAVSQPVHLANGDEIWAGTDPCDGADATNTDIVVVTTDLIDEVTVSLDSGPFAPGKTAEPDGSSEIEFEISGGTVLTIQGSAGPDRISAATGGGFAMFDLNADEVEGDADVTVPRSDLFASTLLLGSGKDTFSGAGIQITGVDPFDASPLTVEGGGGADTIAPGVTDGTYLGDATDSLGSPGLDTFDLGWLPQDCITLILNGYAEERSSWSCDDHTLSSGPVVNAFERVLGHAGEDRLYGSDIDEEFVGRGGSDVLYMGGDDVASGGAGWDLLTFGGGAYRVNLGGRTASGGFGTISYAGIEGIVIDDDANAADDVIFGDPGRSFDFLDAGAGDNVLNLRAVDHGLRIHGVAGALDDPGLYGPGLWVSGVTVLGTPFDDRMSGEPGSDLNGHDEFRGLGGDDHLEGGPGPDTLLGGDGDDVIRGGAGVDTCAGGAGLDIVSGCEA